MSSGGKIRKPDYNNFYETFSSWWDINRAVVEDFSNDGFDYQRVQNENGNDIPTDGQLVTYRMKTNGNRYLVPSESYFEFRFDMTQSDGEALDTDGSKIYVYDGGNCFYFDRASYFIGEREVERRDYCDVAEIIDRLLNAPNTKQNKSGWRIETGLGLNNLTTDTYDPSHTKYNKGASHKIQRDTANNYDPGTYNLRISLQDLFNLHNYYPIAWRGQEHQIRLQLKNPSDGSVILKEGGGSSVINIKRLVLWSATVRPSANRQSELLAMAGDESKQLMQWEAMNVFQKSFSDPGSTTVNWRITDASTRVQRVVIMVRNADQLTTQQEVNSHIVPPNRRPETAYINYNGVKVPQIDLSTDSGAQYNRFYMEYLRCAGYGRNSIDSAPLTYEEFVNAYALICFDLSQLDKQVDSFAALSTLDLSASFSGSGNIVLTACVFQDRSAYLQNGKDAMMIESVVGLN